jgi:hypothetical protein
MHAAPPACRVNRYEAVRTEAGFLLAAYTKNRLKMHDMIWYSYLTTTLFVAFMHY